MSAALATGAFTDSHLKRKKGSDIIGLINRNYGYRRIESPCSRFALLVETPAIPRKRVGKKPVSCYNQSVKSKFGGSEGTYHG